MKNVLIGSLLAASTCFAVVGQANAVSDNTTQRTAQMQQHKGDMSANRGPLSKLNLTASQQAQIKAIREAKKAERTNNREQNKAKHEQMRQQTQALVNANTLDTTALNRLADQHALQSKQRFIDRVQSQQAIAKVLTAEQRAQMQQMKAERGQQGERDGKSGRGHGRNGA